MKRINRRWWMGLRVVLGGVLLVLAFRQINWSEIGPFLAGASPSWLLLGLGSVLLSLGLRIWRWQRLLANYDIRPGWLQIAGAYLIGQSANIVMPFRSGEILRFGWLRARYMQGSMAMVASIAIEKYLDLGMLLLFFIGVIPYLPAAMIEANLASMLVASGLLTVFIVAGAVSGPRIGLWLSALLTRSGLSTRSALLAPSALQERSAQPDNRQPGRMAWAARLVEPLAQWLVSNAWMQSPRRFLPALLLSLSSWLVMGTTNLLVMRAVGLDWDLRAGVLVLVLVYVGSVPALVPGNIGPFHFFSMLGLSLLGITGGQSAAFALFLHALVTLPPLLLSAGLVMLDRKTINRAIDPAIDNNDAPEPGPDGETGV